MVSGFELTWLWYSPYDILHVLFSLVARLEVNSSFHNLKSQASHHRVTLSSSILD
jgi:hypothetical protein